MLNGEKLGQAIAKAISLKKASGAISREVEVARHFKVKQPSLADWKKRGTISKDKLPELWRYFSDVVGPEHWGLKEWSTDSGPPAMADARNRAWEAYERTDAATRALVDAILGVGTSPKWMNRTVRGFLDGLLSEIGTLDATRTERKKKSAA
jgi:hypothetical protein